MKANPMEIYPHRPTPQGYVDPSPDITRRKPTEPVASFTNRMVDAQVQKLCAKCQTVYEYRRPSCPQCSSTIHRHVIPKKAKLSTRPSKAPKPSPPPTKTAPALSQKSTRTSKKP